MTIYNTAQNSGELFLKSFWYIINFYLATASQWSLSTVSLVSLSVSSSRLIMAFSLSAKTNILRVYFRCAIFVHWPRKLWNTLGSVLILIKLTFLISKRNITKRSLVPTLLLRRDRYKQCCGSGMFIPDSNFFLVRSRICIKEFKYFYPKYCF